MKKVIEKIVGGLSGILLAALVLAGCSDLNEPKNDVRTGGKVKISFSVGNLDSRTIMPLNLTEDEVVKAVITAKQLQINGEYSAYTFDEKESLEWEAGTKDGEELNAIDMMRADSVTLDTGTYNFTLELYADINGTESVVQAGEILAKTIESENNIVSFDEMSYVRECGDLAITLTWNYIEGANPIGKVEGGLFTLESKGVASAVDLNGNENDFIVAALTEESDSASVNYTVLDVPNGSYLLKIKLYDSEDTSKLLNTITDIVKIHGFKTKKTIELDLEKVNVLYKVSYNLNGGSWGEGEEESKNDTRRNAYTAVTLTNEIPVRDDFEFAGWYTDKACSEENEISEILAGIETAHDYTIYAKWAPVTADTIIEVTVKAGDSNDISVSHTESNTKLNFTAELPDSTKDYTYTLKIDGKVQDSIEIQTLNMGDDGAEAKKCAAFTVDGSKWVSGVYDIFFSAKDSVGEYYSYSAQIEWTRIYTITFDTTNAPSTVDLTAFESQLATQYVIEENCVVEPELVTQDVSGSSVDCAPTFGWYTDPEFTDLFDFDVVPAHSMTLYGCWNIDTIYVSNYGYSGTGRGTAAMPLGQIADAVALMNDSSTDYTIIIDGEITGAQTIAAINTVAPDGTTGATASISAKSITLEGLNGSDRDILNGGFKTSSSSPYGTTLTISTTVPVTIKKLAVKGGNAAEYNGVENGGGIVLSAGASLTLDEDSLITENTAYVRGGGIYAQGENITITMNSGAKVTKNNLTFTGDQLHGGWVYDGGAGIYISGDGVTESSTTKLPVLIVNDGAEISENEAAGVRRGAGVHVKNAKMEFNGGKITKNTSDDCAANMYVDGENSLVTMTGGEISHGQASYAGGLFVNGGKFTMTGGKICNNIAGSNGNAGGVRIGASGVFEMTGGEISDNYINNSGDRNGGGVYLDNAASTFKIGGNAVISSGATIDGELVTGVGYNDVYLAESAKITILGELTGTAPVATITPEGYSTTTQWLEVSNVTQEGMTSTTLGKECGKFAVTPTTGTDAAGSTTATNYLISSSGNLVEYNATASTVASYIENMSESGTVRLAGAIDSNTIENIRDALRNLYAANNSVKVTLDLSYTTGLTKLSAFNFGVNGQNGGCYSLVSLLLPEGLNEIDELVFKDCSNLQTLSIPSTVTKIAGRAFYGCTSLSTISFPNESDSFGFGTDKALYSADGKRLVLYCGILEEPDVVLAYTVPANVEVIGDYAFQGSSITHITFQSNSTLKTIETDAFYECKRLTAIDIPDSVTAIEGECAFAYCESLESVDLPAGLETIASSMCFMGCKKLTDITIPDGMKSLPYYIFGDSGLTTVSLPDTLESIGENAFRNCKMTSIVLPASLTKIENEAFYGCTALTTVYYKGTEEEKAAMTISDTTIAALTWKAPVTLTAGSESAGTFASISDAVAKIVSLNSSSADYTITVDGELVGAQTLPTSLSGKANSITLTGKNGSSTDILNGNKEGTTLTIGSVDTYSSMPSVTITNLKITGGSTTGNGGGIIAGMGAKLTISEGTLITENTASGNGGGVYLCEQVYFSMDGGSITSNLAVDGAGIYTNSTMGGTLNGSLFNGGGVMSGGTISANTASRNGGGVFVGGTDSFAMTGGSITDNNADGNGKGVYVASMGTSTGAHSLFMGESAFIASGNDVYLSANTGNTYYPNKGIYLLSPLTYETTPVASITPESYTAGNTVLTKSQTPASSTSVDAEYTKFAVTPQADDGTTTYWKLNETGNLAEYELIGSKPAPTTVGDIVFSDGSAIAYSSGLTLTDTQKAAAVAVIFYVGTSSDALGEKKLGIGIHNSTKDGEKYSWPEGSYDYSSIYSEEVTGSVPETPYVRYSYGGYCYITGDLDGSDNLVNLLNANTGTTEDTFPPLKWAANYGKTYGLSGNYATGWWLPTGAEMTTLRNNLYGFSDSSNKTLDTILVLAGGEGLGLDFESNNSYMVSNRVDPKKNTGTNYAFWCVGSTGYARGVGTGSESVCAIREF